MSQHPWVHITEHGRQAKEYIHDRRTGKVKSLKTPWDKLNNQLLNGLEWQSVVEIAGNSGCGKTLMKDQLTRDLFELNPDQDFAVLDFQFEMIGRTSVLRDVSRALKKDIKHLSSAFNPLSDDEFESVSQYIDSRLGTNDLYVIDSPKSVPLIEKAVWDFYNYIRKPIVATIDHSMLVERGVEGDDFEVIRTLGKMLIRTKKELPIIWIVLNQYNREFERGERQVPNNLSAYPSKKDIYGGDSLYFAADVVIAMSKPYMYLPLGSFYGPKNFGITVTETTLVWHILKNRVGEPNTHVLMNAKYNEMRIEDPSMVERPKLKLIQHDDH